MVFLCKILFTVVWLLTKFLSPTKAYDFNDVPLEEFSEELYVKSSSKGFVNTYFQFTTKWRYGERENLHNTKLTPRAIAEILLQYDVKELHISLTSGHWKHEDWGFPVLDAAPGAEMWAWFVAPTLTKAEVDRQWFHMSGILSGILCSSLNFIDTTNSVEPKYGFRPHFFMGNRKNFSKAVRYASLPREVVCTENLTPWKKLLPCSSKYGLASLLSSSHVHDTHYHSLGIKLRTVCENYEENCILEFTETANFVFDLKLFGQKDFSLRRLFGQGLNGHCSLTQTSKIYVDLENDQYILNPPPKKIITSRKGGTMSKYALYDVQEMTKEGMFNMVWVLKNIDEKKLAIVPLTPLYVHRYILGYGQKNGKLVTKIVNNFHINLPIILQEHIPWYVPIYLHTIKIEKVSRGRIVGVIEPKKIYYVPGISRKKAYHLELLFDAPANSMIQVSIDFDYMFLKWLEYPPDANHGHYLGSAVVTTQLPIARNYTSIPLEGSLFADTFNASRVAYNLIIHTESLIISLPTPDFSMPYNVICLACTVVALAFGPIHSVATKRIIVDEQEDSDSSLSKIKKKILFWSSKFKNSSKKKIVEPKTNEKMNK